MAGIDYEKLSLIAALGLALTGALRGWWVPGTIYRQVLAERDRALLTAADAVKLAERVTANWLPARRGDDE